MQPSPTRPGWRKSAPGQRLVPTVAGSLEVMLRWGCLLLSWLCGLFASSEEEMHASSGILGYHCKVFQPERIGKKMLSALETEWMDMKLHKL